MECINARPSLSIFEWCVAVGDFYGIEIEIWAGFGPVDITEMNKFGPIMGNFFMFSWAKKTKKKL